MINSVAQLMSFPVDVEMFPQFFEIVFDVYGGIMVWYFSQAMKDFLPKPYLLVLQGLEIGLLRPDYISRLFDYHILL